MAPGWGVVPLSIPTRRVERSCRVKPLVVELQPLDNILAVFINPTGRMIDQFRSGGVGRGGKRGSGHRNDSRTHDGEQHGILRGLVFLQQGTILPVYNLVALIAIFLYSVGR